MQSEAVGSLEPLEPIGVGTARWQNSPYDRRDGLAGVGALRGSYRSVAALYATTWSDTAACYVLVSARCLPCVS